MYSHGFTAKRFFRLTEEDFFLAFGDKKSGCTLNKEN